jgi:hypothetical protein
MTKMFTTTIPPAGRARLKRIISGTEQTIDPYANNVPGWTQRAGEPPLFRLSPYNKHVPRLGRERQEISH